jgi:Family of unknown function (DUF6174)
VPETGRLDRAVADRIAAYRPETLPPFTAVEDARRRRRRVRTGAAAGLAAVAVAGVLAVPAVLRDPAPGPAGDVPAAAPAPSTVVSTIPHPEPTPVPAGELARQRWQTNGARSYTIKVTLLCFCSPTRPRTVIVRDGKTLGDGPSVADLFETIFSGGFDKVTATYDPTYGFPTRVIVDPDLNTIDEERTWVVTDYHPGS